MTVQRELVERATPGLHSVVFERLTGLRPPPLKVLDLGAGTGAWADRLLAAGYEVTALEQSNGGYSGSSPVVFADLNGGFVSQLNGQTFDVVTCIEVIEHVENPRELLRGARSLLSPGGIIIVTTPNFESTAGRLRFLWTGELRHFGRDPQFNDPTHISPIHTLMFMRALDAADLVLVEHWYDQLRATGSRWPFRLIARVLDPFLRGARGGNNHIYIIAPVGITNQEKS